jgi:recombination protein RecA
MAMNAAINICGRSLAGLSVNGTLKKSVAKSCACVYCTSPSGSTVPDMPVVARVRVYIPELAPPHLAMLTTAPSLKATVPVSPLHAQTPPASVHAATSHIPTIHAATFTDSTLNGVAVHAAVLPARTLATQNLELQTIPTGLPALDVLGGVPQAALTQVCIPQNMASGKMAVLCSLLSQATGREEVCALIDAGDRFDTASAVSTGVDLSRLLWVRCGKKLHAAPDGKFLLPLRCKKTSQSALDDKSQLSVHHGGNSNAAPDDRSLSSPHCEKNWHAAASDGELSFSSKQKTPSAKITNGKHKSVAEQKSTNQKPTNPKHATQLHSDAPENVRRESDQQMQAGESRIVRTEFRSADARRMQPIEQAFKAADILIQNGGFGLIVIDLGEIDERLVRKIPLTTWFRFARVIERQPTALVVFATYPAAQSCAALTLHIKNAATRWIANAGPGAAPQNSVPAHGAAMSHAQILSGLECEVELGRVRGRLRKPAQCSGAEAGKRTFSAIPVWK